MTDQQKIDQLKKMHQLVISPDNQLSDDSAEKVLRDILSISQRDIEEIFQLVLADLKQQFHTEKKQLENYRDRAEKINQQLQQL